MSLTLGDNFSYQASKPLDARLKYDSVAAMKAVGDSTMYEGCLAYCVATDKTYQWKSTNSVDSSTGRWREFSSGGGDDANAYHTTDTAETTLADNDYVPFYDTSASGARKSLWSNIKSVLKTYFDSLYQKTLTAGTYISFSGTNNTTINASLPVLGTINRSDIYDTTEKVVGKWTDGRPIYQKTFTFTTPSTLNTDTAIVTVSKVSTLVGMVGGFIVRADGGLMSFNSTYPSQTNSIYSFIASSNNQFSIFIRVTVNTDAGRSGYVTLQYTKSTDSANSYNYASENDYSTSEKIIGTWIDGKTLYQKTVQATMPTVTTDGTGVNASISWASLGMSTPSKIIEIQGIIHNTNTTAFRPVNLCTIDNGISKFTSAVGRLDTGLQLQNSLTAFNGMTAYITIKYTKS